MGTFILRVLVSEYDKDLFLSNDVLPSLTPLLSKAKIFDNSQSLELQTKLPDYIYYLNRTYFPRYYGEIIKIDKVDINDDK